MKKPPDFYNDDNRHDNLFLQLTCDYNSVDASNPYNFGLGIGPYTISKKCFSGKTLSRIALEYMNKFFNLYSKERKFYHLRLIGAHEFTGETNRFLDEELSTALRQLDKDGHLQNTITWIYSDHGDHINSALWKKTVSGYAEMVNPFMFLVIPDALDKQIAENLKANQQKLITHYDIFRSVIKYWKLPFAKDVVQSQSLFYDKIDSNRTCLSEIYDQSDCRCWFSNSTNKNDYWFQKDHDYFTNAIS